MRPSNYDLQAQAAGGAQASDAHRKQPQPISIWSFCMSRCAFPARTARQSGSTAASGCLRPSARP